MTRKSASGDGPHALALLAAPPPSRARATTRCASPGIGSWRNLDVYYNNSREAINLCTTSGTACSTGTPRRTSTCRPWPRPGMDRPADAGAGDPQGRGGPQRRGGGREDVVYTLNFVCRSGQRDQAPAECRVDPARRRRSTSTGRIQLKKPAPDRAGVSLRSGGHLPPRVSPTAGPKGGGEAGGHRPLHVTAVSPGAR